MRKNFLRNSFRKLGLESLEDRNLLAAGLPVPQQTATPNVSIVNQPALAMVLPGQNGALLARELLATDHYAQAKEMVYLPAFGGVNLAQNVHNFTLHADMGNGADTVIATTQANWQTDIVDFNINQPVWVRPGSQLLVWVTGDFNMWISTNAPSASSNGTCGVGVELAYASFTDLRGNSVPDSNVAYAGVPPILQTLECSTVQISQMQLPQAVTVFPGGDMDLLRFYVNTNNATLSTVTFVATEGSVLNATNYRLTQDINGDGSPEFGTMGSVRLLPQNPALAVVEFDLSPLASQFGGTFNVYATAMAPAQLQLTFAGSTGVNPVGNQLIGTIINGDGGGQIEIWKNVNFSTVYTVANLQPALIVKEIPSASPINVTANPGDNVLVDSFTAQPWNATATNLTVSHVAIVATGGSVYNCSGYTLLTDTNNDGKVDTTVAMGNIAYNNGVVQIVFDNFSQKISPAGTLFEVHADISVGQPYYGTVIQAQLAGNQGIIVNRDNVVQSFDQVFTDYAVEPAWQLPITIGPSISDLMSQVAALQAQLASLSGGLG